MTKNLILVELPDIENEIVGELDESTKIAFLSGFRQCLDAIQSKSLKVDVEKLEKIIDKWNTHRPTARRKCALEIKQAIESGEVLEEGK